MGERRKEFPGYEGVSRLTAKAQARRHRRDLEESIRGLSRDEPGPPTSDFRPPARQRKAALRLPPYSKAHALQRHFQFHPREQQRYF